MPLQEALINQTVLKRLANVMQNGRLAHAYMFVGPTDSGKGETAKAVALLVNCDNADLIQGHSCGVCPACLKMSCGPHPDIHIVYSDDGETIKIDQVRELLAQSRLRPFEARRKVFIIRNVEQLTAEGANALLKTLEEPGGNSLFILTTAHLEKNLDTILSRCQRMTFLPEGKEKLAGRLVKHYDVEARQAHFLAFFAEGAPGKARRFLNEKISEDKDGAIDHFLLSDNSESYLKKILADKRKTKVFLDVLFSWARDCWLVKAGGPPGMLIHADRLRDLERFQARFNLEALQEFTGEIINTRRLLAENLNIKIPIMMIKERMM